MTISRRLRFEILRRDKHTCRYCGAMAPDVPLTVDHVIPSALGGSDEPTNLVTACQPCNAGKSSVPADTPIVEDVQRDAIRWAKAMQLAATYRAADRAAMQDAINQFDDAWQQWHITRGGNSTPDPIPRDDNWRTSIERFLENGIPLDELLHLVDVAMHSQSRPDSTWRYFCGCAWRAITDLQETARLILDQEEHRGP